MNLAKKMSRDDTSQAIGQFAYLVMDSELEEYIPPSSKEDLSNLKTIIHILQKNSSYFVKKTSINFMKLSMEGLDLKDAFNHRMGVQLLNMGKCHSLVAITENFYNKIQSLPEGPIKSAIHSLAIIYACEILKEMSANLMESGSLNPDHIEILSELMEEHIEKITPDLLVLAEAIPIQDEVLMSAIGHSNGKPYENLYEWAKKYGSLNHFPDGVHPEIAKTNKALRQQRL